MKIMLAILTSLVSHSVLAETLKTSTNLLTSSQLKSLPNENYLKIFAGLAVVLLIMWLLVFILKKFNHVIKAANGKIQMLSVMSLGQKEKIMLIQVENIRILVGVSPGSIRKIHVLPNTAPNEKLNSERTEPFISQLQNAIKKEEGAAYDKK